MSVRKREDPAEKESSDRSVKARRRWTVREPLGGAEAILALQRRAGNRAVAAMFPGAREPIQRALKNPKYELHQTPARKIKDALRIPNYRLIGLGVPDQAVQAEIPRPTSIEADITENSIRGSDRKDSDNLDNVRAMARTERWLLHGFDPWKFYDAGHLVGDFLVAGDDNTASAYTNLAPQMARFNEHDYLAEEKKVARAVKEKKQKVGVKVQLVYGSAFSMSIGDLKKRLSLPEDYQPGDGKPALVNANQVEFPRRVPEDWTMTTTKAVRDASSAKPKSKAYRDVVAKGLGNPTLGDPYTTDFEKKTIDGGTKRERVLRAKQWQAREGFNPSDIKSLLAVTFPDHKAAFEQLLASAPGAAVDSLAVEALAAAQTETISMLLKLSARVLQAPPAVAPYLREVVLPAVAPLMDALAGVGSKGGQQALMLLASAKASVKNLDDLVDKRMAEHQATGHPDQEAAAWEGLKVEQAFEAGRKLHHDGAKTLAEEQLLAEAAERDPKKIPSLEDLGGDRVLTRGDGSGIALWPTAKGEPPLRFPRGVMLPVGGGVKKVVVEDLQWGTKDWVIHWRLSADTPAKVNTATSPASAVSGSPPGTSTSSAKARSLRRSSRVAERKEKKMEQQKKPPWK